MNNWVGHAVRRRIVSGATAVLALTAGAAVWATLASATPSKLYSISVNHTSVAAGHTQQYTFTLTNSAASLQPFGSANITAQNGFTLSGPLSTDHPLHWTVCLGDGSTCGAGGDNVIMLRSSEGSGGLGAGHSITVSVDATAPCSGSSPTDLWASAVKQSNNFASLVGNSFANTGSDPNVTVTGGGPGHFGVTLPSASFTATAGTPFDATVTSYDGCGNPTPYAGVGSLGGNLDDAPDGTPASYGAVSFDGATASVPVSAYDAEGGRTLTFSAPGFPDATSASFAVVPGAPASDVFTTQPNSGGNSVWKTKTGNSLTQFGAVVSLYDSWQNLATNATGTVGLSLDQPLAAFGAGGTLGGTVPGAVGGGMASFSDLTVSKSGVGYMLDAAYPGTPGATSDSFDVYDVYSTCSGNCTTDPITTGSGSSQSQDTPTGSGDFASIGLGAGTPGYIPAGCLNFVPLTPDDVPVVVIDTRNSVSGTLKVVFGASISAIQKRNSSNSGQQFTPICVGAKRIALGSDGKTHGVDCNQPYPGPHGPITQATTANPSQTGWWGKTLDANGKFVPGSVTQAVCDPVTGYFFGIAGSFQDYHAPKGQPTIDPANSPTVTGWGTDPSGLYRDFSIVFPASSHDDAASAALANVPWDGWNMG